MPTKRVSCACCLLPFSKDPLGEKRESPDYCSYCFHNGVLGADSYTTLSEFQKDVRRAMQQQGHSWLLTQIATCMIRFAPYWKNRSK